MQSPCPEERGYSLLEALLALLIGAAVMTMLFEVLSADALQTRTMTARNHQSAGLVRAHREFLAVAAVAQGPGTSERAGDLVISQDHLRIASRDGQPLLSWSRGRGTLDYSTDGRLWAKQTPDSARDMIRFTWRSGQQELVWIAP